MAKSNPVKGLTRFENRDVLQSTIAITKAGDGLSEALKIDPTEFQLGDTVYVVLETEVSKVQYVELGETGTLKRVHTLKAGVATVVDSQLVAGVLEEQKLAIERAKGVERLPLDDDDE